MIRIPGRSDLVRKLCLEVFQNAFGKNLADMRVPWNGFDIPVFGFRYESCLLLCRISKQSASSNCLTRSRRFNSLPARQLVGLRGFGHWRDPRTDRASGHSSPPKFRLASSSQEIARDTQASGRSSANRRSRWQTSAGFSPTPTASRRTRC